jgi:hypothetical protein
VKRQTRLFPQSAGKSAFAASGTADYHNALHQVTSVFFFIISKGRKIVKEALDFFGFL